MYGKEENDLSCFSVKLRLTGKRKQADGLLVVVVVLFFLLVIFCGEAKIPCAGNWSEDKSVTCGQDSEGNELISADT